ncbi:MAG: formylglycine-generating enzyme family protein [Treponema sp.]|nr:formylglycine-generating enzyme family protein [Treponema sp.]
MTEKTFESILSQIMTERGVKILDTPSKCSNLLQDYASGGFKREIRLLIQTLEAGYHKELLKSEEPEITVKILVKKFQDDYGTAKEVAEEIINILAVVLEGSGKSDEDKQKDEIKKLTIKAEKDDVKAQYELGTLFYKLKEYDESYKWLEIAARKGMEICSEKNVKKDKKQNLVISKQDKNILNNMILINGGTFIMGSPEFEAGRVSDEGPQHQVSLNSLYMSIYPVTQKEYQDIIGINPSIQKGENFPVTNVNWFNAIYYCNKLSEKDGLIPVYFLNENMFKIDVKWDKDNNGYRLPTEAEWEYACRAGTSTPFYTGNSISSDEANFNGSIQNNKNETGIFREKITSVGSFPSNAWGLHDMHGNVWEWCWDKYGDYSNIEQVDPTGKKIGFTRVRRGGSYNNEKKILRAAYRNYYSPSDMCGDTGFRIVRNG